MKYQIREGENSIDGTPIFRIYMSPKENEWHYVHSEISAEKCRAFIERRRNPKPETVVFEVEL